MVGSIPHAIACGMHNVECIGIPYGHITMSHDHVVCLFEMWNAFLKKKKKQKKKKK